MKFKSFKSYLLTLNTTKIPQRSESVIRYNFIKSMEIKLDNSKELIMYLLDQLPMRFTSTHVSTEYFKKYELELNESVRKKMKMAKPSFYRAKKHLIDIGWLIEIDNGKYIIPIEKHVYLTYQTIISIQIDNGMLKSFGISVK